VSRIIAVGQRQGYWYAEASNRLDQSIATEINGLISCLINQRGNAEK
jgi:hypothetical protein